MFPSLHVWGCNLQSSSFMLCGRKQNKTKKDSTCFPVFQASQAQKEFLSSKDTVAQSILQADRTLTEHQKLLEGEPFLRRLHMAYEHMRPT